MVLGFWNPEDVRRISGVHKVIHGDYYRDRVALLDSLERNLASEEGNRDLEIAEKRCAVKSERDRVRGIE